jgi:hypothetical protein
MVIGIDIAVRTAVVSALWCCSTVETSVMPATGTADGGFQLQVVTPSTEDRPLLQMSFGVVVRGQPPPDTTWYKIDQLSGPPFSGLKGGFWFPRAIGTNSSSSNTGTNAVAVKWWSEYEDRDDHDASDPSHSNASSAPDVVRTWGQITSRFARSLFSFVCALLLDGAIATGYLVTGLAAIWHRPLGGSK